MQSYDPANAPSPFYSCKHAAVISGNTSYNSQSQPVLEEPHSRLRRLPAAQPAQRLPLLQGTFALRVSEPQRAEETAALAAQAMAAARG